MRKMLTLLATLFIIYFGIQIAFNYFGKGHDINYQIKTDQGDINIHEVLTTNNDEKNNYFFNVNYEDKDIPFKIYNAYNRKSKIIKNVYIFESDSYMCAKLELESDNTPSDIKCVKDGIAYFYSDIKGQDSSIDNLISQSDYNVNDYTNNESDNFKKDNLVIYPNNFPSKQTILMEAYKGIYLVGNDVTSKARFIKLFDNDVYDKHIEAISGKYYIVANYNKTHEFNEIYVVNISNGTTFTIDSTYDISFNSFIEGVNDDSVYLIDKDSKKQYQIDITNKKVTIVGNEQDGAKTLVDGTWTTANISEIINSNKTFTQTIDNVNNIKYDKIILEGNKENGTYYVATKNGDNYQVYAIYTASNVKTYLFTTTDVDRIFINGSYIYYQQDDNLMVFSSDFGNRKILTNNELKYNKNILYMSH